MDHADIDHTGLTGTGGSVATDAIWDAAGDLAVGSGANTAAKLTLGAAGTSLVSNGTTAVWAVPSLVGAKVYNSGTQSINDVTETDLTYDSEEWDTAAFHSTGAATERLTIPTGYDGYYECWAHVHFNSGGNVGYRYAKFVKNAATEVRSQTIYDGAGVTTRAVSQLIHTTLYLVATDYIHVKAYQDSGGAMNMGSVTLQQQCYIEIRRVGV